MVLEHLEQEDKEKKVGGRSKHDPNLTNLVTSNQQPTS